MKTFTVKDSVAFVTGTNKPNGIGRAIVDALIKGGAKKVYATARNVSQLDGLVKSSNGKVEAVALDVTSWDDIAKLGASYPDVTLVINNAGYAGMKAATECSIETAQAEMNINYVAPMAIVQSFTSALKANSTPDAPTAVVNIASIASFVNFPLAGTYSASKAAAHSLTQAQRRELMDTTLVMGVYPGPIDTDMAKGVPMDKTSPADVAASILGALAKGEEDHVPDAMAQGMFAGWKGDFKAMEAQMAEMAKGGQGGDSA